MLIPKALRDALSLKAGEQLEVKLEGGVLHLRPASRSVQTVQHAGRLILDAPSALTGDPVEDTRARPG